MVQRKLKNHHNRLDPFSFVNILNDIFRKDSYQSLCASASWVLPGPYEPCLRKGEGLGSAVLDRALHPSVFSFLFLHFLAPCN